MSGGMLSLFGWHECGAAGLCWSLIALTPAPAVGRRLFRPLVRGPPAACPCPPVLTHCHPHPHPHPHSCRHAPSLEALDLHLLGAAPMGAADDTSSEAGAEGGEDGCTREAAAAAGAGLKRQACEGLASPPGRGLMLHMNYEKATESINLELLSGRSK